MFIDLQNWLLYYCCPFFNPNSLQYLELNCKIQYEHANQGILAEAYIIWVQYIYSKDNNLGNTFQE
jgi:hypothetical protein